MSDTVKVSIIPHCDFCDLPAKYDGKTIGGPWANMCEEHFLDFGIGLGTGKGQKLEAIVAEGTVEPIEIVIVADEGYSAKAQIAIEAIKARGVPMTDELKGAIVNVIGYDEMTDLHTRTAEVLKKEDFVGPRNRKERRLEARGKFKLK